MTIGPGHYAVLSALVLCVGLGGVMTGRQALAQLLALGVAFTAPVIAVMGFSQTQGTPPVGANTGVGFSLIVLMSFTAEAACGAAILMVRMRRRHNLDLDPPAGTPH